MLPGMTDIFLFPTPTSTEPSPFALDAQTAPGSQELVLYTDSHIVRGSLPTRFRRLTDLLNAPGEPFIVLEEVTFEEFGSRALIERAPFAQVNLSTVLFAMSDQEAPTSPEMRTLKSPREALIIIPPWRITGSVHLMPERGLRDALEELTGRFIPVTGATFWSERLNEPNSRAPMLAFNHARAQVLAPHEEKDVWGGAGTTAG